MARDTFSYNQETYLSWEDFGASFDFLNNRRGLSDQSQRRAQKAGPLNVTCLYGLGGWWAAV